jgi:phosphopantetheine adenylyltransferase
MFTPDERMEMVRREVAGMGVDNVEVVGFNALLMTFAEKQGRASFCAACALLLISNMNIRWRA